jgi:hypothetical protein
MLVLRPGKPLMDGQYGCHQEFLMSMSVYISKMYPCVGPCLAGGWSHNVCILVCKHQLITFMSDGSRQKLLSIVWNISGQVSSSCEDYDDVPCNKTKLCVLCCIFFLLVSLEWVWFGHCWWKLCVAHPHFDNFKMTLPIRELECLCLRCFIFWNAPWVLSLDNVLSKYARKIWKKQWKRNHSWSDGMKVDVEMLCAL